MSTCFRFRFTLFFLAFSVNLERLVLNLYGNRIVVPILFFDFGFDIVHVLGLVLLPLVLRVLSQPLLGLLLPVQLFMYVLKRPLSRHWVISVVDVLSIEEGTGILPSHAGIVLDS